MLRELLSRRSWAPPVPSARSEAGFTLIELLVTMLAGMIILGVLFTIEATTLHQTTRAFSKVDATSHARVGIEQLENELHSACITNNVTPVLSGSTATTVMFVSQYGAGASLVPVEHVVSFNSSAGTLTDATYAETGMTTNSSGAPVYTFASSPSSTRTVLTNVTQTGSSPVFQYFAYQTVTNPATGATYNAPDGNPYELLVDGTNAVPGTTYIPTASPLSTPLSSTDAADTVEVMISLTVGPSGGSNEVTSTTAFGGGNYSDVADSVQDGVVLRLTPAPNEDSSGATFLPCQ